MYFEPGKLYGAWKSGVAIDPGQPSYSDHLVELARRYVERLPETEGICIDRLDISTLFNERRDDGVSWFKDKPARSLLTSWLAVMERIGPVMHEANKVIVANPIRRRIEMMKHLDGFYDESGQNTRAFNLGSFVALRKPYIAWTQRIKDPTPDEFFQRHLYMGSFVTVPFLGISHTLPPSGAGSGQAIPGLRSAFRRFAGTGVGLEGRSDSRGGSSRQSERVRSSWRIRRSGRICGESRQRESNAPAACLGRQGVNNYRTESIRPGETTWSVLDE